LCGSKALTVVVTFANIGPTVNHAHIESWVGTLFIQTPNVDAEPAVR
jgi:hypothetical protein